jgi:acyl-CoA synthetase (AMP-forming)/AMP-acid ligase II
MAPIPVPVEYGRRLLASLIDQIARDTPDRTYAEYLGKNWEREGFTEITYGQFATAIDKAAYWLDETFGKARHFETVAYSGVNDLRYAFFIVAAQKTGRKVSLKNWESENSNISILSPFTFPMPRALLHCRH